MAKNEIEKVEKIEPQITQDLKYIASINGSKLEGLEFRIKSEESLTRKIIVESKEKGVSFEEAAAGINDKLRYTIVKGESEFTENYFRTVEELHTKGYNNIRVRNTFKDGVTYKGINTLVTDRFGNVFELQYHTPKSIEVKEGILHKLYEEQRVLDKVKDKKEFDFIEDKMIKLSNTIPIPFNAERIK